MAVKMKNFKKSSNKTVFKNLKVPYKTCDVDMYKRCHQILTIKSVHYPTMSRNSVCKILQKQTNIFIIKKKKSFAVKFLSVNVSLAS